MTERVSRDKKWSNANASAMAIAADRKSRAQGWRAARVVVLLLPVLLFAATALADAITPKQMAGLASKDFATRDQATRELLADESLNPSQLAKHYRLATVAEQRARLQLIARHHFLREVQAREFPGSPRQPRKGALGVRFEPTTAEQVKRIGHPGIFVGQTYPGFPAFAHLRSGDLIVAIKRGDPDPDNPFLGFHKFSHGEAGQIEDEFRQRVTNVRAGDTLSMLIYRDGKLVKEPVAVKLGSLDALRNVYAGTTGELQPKYRDQWHSFLRDLRGLGPDRNAIRVRLPKQPVDEPAPVDE